MATANSMSELTPPPAQSSHELLVVLSPMAAEQLEVAIGNLAASFPPHTLLVAAQEGVEAEAYPTLELIAAPAAEQRLTLTAADYAAAHQMAEKHGVRTILLLGPESGSLEGRTLRKLAQEVQTAAVDLAIPCYDMPPHAGLVNSAILYPLTRALFVSNARFPLAIDLGLSLRMAERMAAAAARFGGANLREVLLWPVNEAGAAGYTIREVDAGPRALPRPVDPDINATLAQVTGSLFAEIDAKAAFWQRARRPAGPRNHLQPAQAAEAPPEIAPMLEAFHLAYSNLEEIWSLVLPPQTLLGLKRLSVAEAKAFRMADQLWARIVYDFVLAYRLRTINRGHLLGALIPLYMAWVASHVNAEAAGNDPERHVEAVAAAFEAEKAYLVSRWRWPDRFNP